VVTYTINMGGIDRNALAEEVMASTARVLILAGFSTEDVGNLFRQASEQLISGEATSPRAESAWVDDDEYDDRAISNQYDLIDRFEQLPAVKTLTRLAKRSSVIGDLDDPTALAKAVDLVTEAVGLRQEALAWVRAEAAKAGLEVADDREAWIDSATDDELDEEDRILFLDDYRFSADFNWYIVAQVVRALAESGDRATFASFSQMVSSDVLAFDHRIKEDVERAIAASEKYDDFQLHVQSYAGLGEVTQTELFDKFIREVAFEGGTYLLEGWLEAMAKRGVLERYKRSNRWRVVVG
jgi:hypothetical protein